MKQMKTTIYALLIMTFTASYTHAAVYSSNDIINQQNHQYTKQHVLSMINEVEVKEKLVSLGVNQQDALTRIEAMTPNELSSLNEQLDSAPAGGIVGTIVTVLVVIAVLDVLGVTDVYPFIRPINS